MFLKIDVVYVLPPKIKESQCIGYNFVANLQCQPNSYCVDNSLKTTQMKHVFVAEISRI